MNYTNERPFNAWVSFCMSDLRQKLGAPCLQDVSIMQKKSPSFMRIRNACSKTSKWHSLIIFMTVPHNNRLKYTSRFFLCILHWAIPACFLIGVCCCCCYCCYYGKNLMLADKMYEKRSPQIWLRKGQTIWSVFLEQSAIHVLCIGHAQCQVMELPTRRRMKVEKEEEEW